MKIIVNMVNHTIQSGGSHTYGVLFIKQFINYKDVSNLYILISKYQKEEFEKIIPKSSNCELIFVDFNKNIFVKLLKELSNIFFDLSDIKIKKSKILKKLASFFDPYKKIVDKLKADIFFTPAPTTFTYSCKTPIVVTMHDVQELIFPEFFTPQERLYRALNYKRSTENCSHIIVSFNHVKTNIISYFRVKDYKISVCPIFVGNEWFLDIKPTDYNFLKNKYKLPENYILYPAKPWKHKNHINLFKAIKILKTKNILVNLVCTGGLNENYNVLIQKIKELDIENQVLFLGVVSQEDLSGLYKNTKLVVIPTLYEAGSGPLFEAMQLNVPVICSNVTSLPETIDNEDFIFDPLSPIDISQKIEKCIFDDSFINYNIENSKRVINNLKSGSFHQNFIDTFKKAIQSNKQN